MRKYGYRFGFDCRTSSFSSPQDLKTYLSDRLGSGHPVLIAFNIGPDMRNAELSLVKLAGSAPHKLDRRLWAPRKTGERNSGGHSVVAVGVFEALDKEYLLMLDSDWDEPRIWDLDEYLGEKTALPEIDIVSCS